MRYLDDDLIVQCSLTPVSTRKLKRLFVLLVRPSIWGESGGHGGGNRTRGRKCYCRGSRRDCSALQGSSEAGSATAEAAEETVVHYKEALQGSRRDCSALQGDCSALLQRQQKRL